MVRHEQIAAELRAAHEHDALAQQCRKRAGSLLAELRGSGSGSWYRVGELDKRTAELLIEIAMGGKWRE